MAVDFIGSIHVYQGLTADTKPISADGVIPVGSTFQELDGDRRLWMKASPGQGSEWLVVTPPATPTNESQILRNQRTMIGLLGRILED